MPIYEYECSDCQFRFERKQSFDEESVVACPECQGQSRRVIRSIPVIFKGSGFYITDSRKRVGPVKGKEELPGKEKGKEKGKKKEGSE